MFTSAHAHNRTQPSKFEHPDLRVVGRNQEGARRREVQLFHRPFKHGQGCGIVTSRAFVGISSTRGRFDDPNRG
jgi:hypothetical protein